MSILVIDIGTSSVRVGRVERTGTFSAERRSAFPPESPAPGLVEFDAARLASLVLDLARQSLHHEGPAEAVAIANQRASTVVWDRSTGEPVAPALGWQDLRTVGACLVLQGQGLRLAPNQSATKAADIWDRVDPDRVRDLCVGTVDSWIAWTLTGGAAHITDPSNAAVTGLANANITGWDPAACAALRLSVRSLPTIVSSLGDLATATALPGSPPLCAMLGDQQASLVGQGAVASGAAKLTLGTGGMLDVCLDGSPPAPATTEHGCFPIVAWRHSADTVWGLEAIMLSAGTNVEWLCEDLGIIPSPEASAEIAASVPDSAGVTYVPALLGLGTPNWDYGARGALLGITRGTTAAHITRAVLEGVAQRAADLLDAVRSDTSCDLSVLRTDGGMSRNPIVMQALADAAQATVEVSPVVEATARGAGLFAGVARGWWPEPASTGDLWVPQAVYEPGEAPDRERWADAVRRAARWHEDLSAISF